MPAESRSAHGEVFLDARGNGRALRLTWHHEADVVVLSLWREDLCAGTFRLATTDVNAFIDALVDGVRDAPGVHTPSPRGLDVPPPAQRTGTQETHAAPPETGDLKPGPRHASPAPSFTEWAFGSDSPRATAS